MPFYIISLKQSKNEIRSRKALEIQVKNKILVLNGEVMQIENLKLRKNEDVLSEAINNNSAKIQTVSQEVASIWNVIYPIGSYYETSNTNFNPNTSWGGIWEKMNGGEMLVDSGYKKESATTNPGSISDVPVNTVVGNKWHTLTIEEMPSHTHTLNNNTLVNRNIVGDGGAQGTNSVEGSTITANNTGGDLRFELTPKARVVVRWHRTA